MAPAIASKILYVNRTGDDGWLEVRPAKPGQLASICKYTKLQVLGSAVGRTSLLIMDGPLKGQPVSLSDGHVLVYLGTTEPVQSLAHIEVTYGKYVPGWISVARNNQALDQQMATLKIGTLTVETTMNTNWGTGFTPIPAGSYTVFVPDAPHKKGNDTLLPRRRTHSKIRSGLVSYQIRRQQPLRTRRQCLRRLHDGVGSRSLG
jgi:hypothetical protein